MKSLIRKNILKLTPYKTGKPIEETKRELGLAAIIKLASNENPLGPCPKAVKAIVKYAPQVNRYPDSQGFYLKRRLARKLNVLPANIVLGNGSDELIDIIIKTFVNDDEHIITADVTFLEYEIIARVNNKRIVTVGLKDHTYDLQAISKSITPKTKLIFIANPNNPTGTYVNRIALDTFIKKLPRHVIVVLDEAYDSFIDVDDYVSGSAYFSKYNVIVLKTFSKAYGLAGVRVGYALAKEGLTPYLEKTRQPFNVNSLAQAAALASLDDDRFLSRTRNAVLEGKRYLCKALDSLGVAYVPSVANFVLIDTGRNGLEVFKKMLKQGVIVRDMQQYGLTDFIRVTVGTMAENRKFIAAFKRII